nr:MAG TPA: hypothetical protein [Caudoviricetes sp.]DAZ46012.1 MAG TPA: hypothetical protein [Caudoviricetes sp.]
METTPFCVQDYIEMDVVVLLLYLRDLSRFLKI